MRSEAVGSRGRFIQMLGLGASLGARTLYPKLSPPTSKTQDPEEGWLIIRRHNQTNPKAEVVNANNYQGIPVKDKNFWRQAKVSYEFVSRFRSIPIIGIFLFLFLDSFQKILGYYPKRDYRAIDACVRT